MKNRADRILLAVFLVSIVLYALLWLAAEMGWMSEFSPWNEALLCFHAVPVFCLQLLLCRRVRRWFTLLPTLVFAAAFAFCLLRGAAAEGWDGLGWAVLWLLTFAPLLGCGMAWIVYGAGWLRQLTGK